MPLRNIKVTLNNIQGLIKCYRMARYIGNCCAVTFMVFCLFNLPFSVSFQSKKCEYQENCDTKICEYKSGLKTCRCLRIIDYSTGENVEQLSKEGACRSRVNQLCSLPTNEWDSRVWEIKCVDNAQCNFAPNGISPRELYGVCECKSGFNSSQSRAYCFASQLEQSALSILTALAAPPQHISTTEQLPATYQIPEILYHKNETNYISNSTTSIVRKMFPINSTEQVTSAHSSTSSIYHEKMTNIRSLKTTTQANHVPVPSREYESKKMILVEKAYHTSCAVNKECSTNFCHPVSHICSCNKLWNYSLNISVEQIYSHSECLSRVYQMCTMPNENVNQGTKKWKCVKGSTCSNKFSENGYMCICVTGFESNHNKTECYEKKLASSSNHYFADDNLLLFLVFLLLIV